MEVRLMGWLPRNTFATLRNATVSAVSAGRATVAIDGGTATGIPIYGGSPASGDKVLVAVQGDQMIVLGAGVGQVVAPVTLNGDWFRNLGDGHAELRACKTGRAVHVSGVIINHSANTFPADGTMGGLPAGFLPDALYPVWGVGAANTHYRIDVKPTGQLVTRSGVSIPSGVWITLDFTYLAAS
jgi:hypothetical protein